MNELFITDSHLKERHEMKTIVLNANLACLKMYLVRNENSAFIYSPSCSSNPLGMHEKVILKNVFVLLFLCF